MLTTKFLSHILNTFNNECVVIDVSNCKETTVTRMNNTLLEYTQFDTSTIKKVLQDGKCLLIKDTNPSSKNINIYRRQSSRHFQLPEDSTVDEFLQTYFANYDDW